MSSPAEAPPPAADDAKKSTSAAAADDSDEDFTPTLWTVDGPVETKPAAPEAADGAKEAVPESVPLSKNARKRLAKQEAWEAKKKQKKEEEREARMKRGEVARAEHAAKLEAMTDEERAKHEEERQAKREIRKKEAEEAKAKKQAALEAPNAVVLDLEFGHLMSDKEQKSMAKQLTFCYSANTKAAVPLRLYLTGLAGSMGEFTRKHNSGFSNWAVHKCDGSYLEALADRKDDLVYLTADSEHELEDFKESDVYIIGGIVDRNRHKNLTLNKANEQGIRHARLPIRDHLKMTGTHILTVNQTLDIIHAQLELKNWEKALERVVPLRKRKEAEEEGKEGGRRLSGHIVVG